MILLVSQSLNCSDNLPTLGLSEWLYLSHNTCLQTFHSCPGESLTTFYHSGIALVGIWNESSESVYTLSPWAPRNESSCILSPGHPGTKVLIFWAFWHLGTIVLTLWALGHIWILLNTNVETLKYVGKNLLL
jgi:hypothetical protein